GLSLGAGANDNTISGNKFEFNSGCGIKGFQAVHNVIVDNVVDRNSQSGIRLASCTQTSILGNMLRRNGAGQQSGTAAEDCHIHIESCSGVVVGQNTTSTGTNDNGSGYLSPKYGVWIQSNTGSVRVVGND